MSDFILVNVSTQGVCELQLNRPSKHNAFNEQMIAELLTALNSIEQNKDIRLVILSAVGKHFSAGADLTHMQTMGNASEADNLTDALQLATLMHTLFALNKPTLAIVQGVAYGGALGLIAACDIAIAAEEARFCLSEVKLGLSPSVISPYVINAIGERQFRRYALTAEIIEAQTAKSINLIHEVQPTDALQLRKEALSALLLDNDPIALSATKALLTSTRGHPIGPELNKVTAKSIASLRLGAPAQARLKAFLDKKP